MAFVHNVYQDIVVYSELIIQLTRKMIDADPKDQEILAWSHSFLTAFSAFPLRVLLMAATEDPNPDRRMWAWRGLNSYRDMNLRFLRQDGTAWN